MTIPENLLVPFYSDGPGDHYIRNLSQGRRLTREQVMEVLDRARLIIMGMDSIEDTDGCSYAVATKEVQQVADLKRLLHDIDRHIPHVEAFVVGYWWGSMRTDGTRNWSGYFGCQGQAQADRLARELQKRWDKKQAHRTPDQWVVRHCDADIYTMLRPTAKPADVAEDLLRRTR